MAQIISTPSIKTQWGLEQMRLLASSGENEMKSQFDEAEVRRMACQGWSDNEIAAHFGATAEQVYKYRYYKKIKSVQPTKSQTKQEESEMPTPKSNIITPPPQKIEQVQETADNVQAMTSNEHDAAHGMIASNPETVGERIDAILALRKATDIEPVNEAFGLLCSRILAVAIGL